MQIKCQISEGFHCKFELSIKTYQEKEFCKSLNKNLLLKTKLLTVKTIAETCNDQFKNSFS